MVPSPWDVIGWMLVLAAAGLVIGVVVGGIGKAIQGQRMRSEYDRAVDEAARRRRDAIERFRTEFGHPPTEIDLVAYMARDSMNDMAGYFTRPAKGADDAEG